MSWYPCKCCRWCPNCLTGQGPIQWQVDIASLANGTCGSCTSLNGTYVLDWVSQCTWRYDLPTAICGVTHVTLEVGAYMYPVGWPISVELRDASNNVVLFASEYAASALDCMNATNHALSNLYNLWGTSTCYAPGGIGTPTLGTVHITALHPCQ